MTAIQNSSLVHRYNMINIAAMLDQPAVETHAGTSSQLNDKMLKQLVAQMASPHKPDTLERLALILSQSGNDTSEKDFKNSKLSTLLEQLKKSDDNAQPSDDMAKTIGSLHQRVKQSARAIVDIQREVAASRSKANYSLSQLKASIAKAPQVALDVQNKTSLGISYADDWADIAKCIGEIKTDYVDFYADLMSKYTQMYEDFNKYVQKAAADAYTAGDDGNKIKVNQLAMQNGYNNFFGAYWASEQTLGSVNEMTFADKASMTKTLEPAFKVDAGSGKISYNLDQYNSIPSFPAGNVGGQVSTASYQAWLATFNAAGSALQSNMQAFAQRYSQANSTFDNLNKILSGAISKLEESAQLFLRNSC